VYGRKLKQLLSGEWDVVHAWEEPYVFSGWQIGRWAQRSRFVFYTFQNIAKRYPPPFGWLEKATIRRAAGWIGAGHSVAQALLPRPGYAGRPNAVIGLGVDTDLFRPDAAARTAIRRTLGWAADGPPVIGYLGRFIPAKGLAVLTQALDAIPAAWRVLFVGGGTSEKELRAWADRHGDRVRVVTGVAHAEVPAYLNAMDVLTAPSQSTPKWREQFGRMLVEGFACGLPVVGSDSGEIPHVVGPAGLVVGEADQAGWAATLAELIDSPTRRAELGASGLERAHAHYAWPVIGRAHVQFFDELLAGRKMGTGCH
jgi:glycosyltransferase involved in cell wall biosynthesis